MSHFARWKERSKYVEEYNSGVWRRARRSSATC